MAHESLVLLPGIACDAELWRAQSAALAGIADCMVIEPQGGSIEAMARHVLDAAPERFGLAGLSLGGYVALAILRLAPERVARLCLANTSARGDGEAQTAGRRVLIEETEAGGFEDVLGRLLPLLTDPQRQDDAALQARVMAMMRRAGPHAFVRQQDAAAHRPDARAGLARIRIPCCVIAGIADRVTPAPHGAEIAAAIPGATLHVLQGCAHLTPMEEPGLVTSIMRGWLGASEVPHKRDGQRIS